MRTILLAAGIVGLVAGPVRAADTELSLETRQMLSYGALAVMTGICKTPLTDAQRAEMNAGLERAAKAQQQLTEEQFTDQMKAAGAQVGQNKDQVCAAVTPDFVANSLKEAAEGQ